MVTDAQVRVLQRRLMEGKTQEAAAAGAGMSVRSARKRHEWRTRPDPFIEVFEKRGSAVVGGR